MAPQNMHCRCFRCGDKGTLLKYNVYRRHNDPRNNIRSTNPEVSRQVESDRREAENLSSQDKVLVQEISKLSLMNESISLGGSAADSSMSSNLSASSSLPISLSAIDILNTLESDENAHIVEVDRLLQVPENVSNSDFIERLVAARNLLISGFYRIKGVDSKGQKSVESRKFAMSKTLHMKIVEVENALKKAQNSGRRETPVTFQTGVYFEHTFGYWDSTASTALFLVLALNVLGRVTRTWCNLVLRVLKTMLKGSLKINSEAGPSSLDHFPTDVRTVRDYFSSRVITTTYASCPDCSFTYSPILCGNVAEYPARCVYKPFPTSKPCNAQVTKVGVLNGESVKTPIRPYLVQDFNAFLANWLSQPGMETLLEHRLSSLSSTDEIPENLTDIADGSVLRNLKDTENCPFFAKAPDDELRLAWSLSIDRFNPYHNKAAGKSASVGVIAMTCLNLPPHLRYKAENLYIAGIIPGPKEPSLDEVNHFLAPIVKALDVAKRIGTFFDSTCDHPQGRLVRSALALVISDLPATRKITGSASHSANSFCSICKSDKSDMNDLNMEKWEFRTHSEQYKAAMKWRDATSQAERTRIFDESGNRWSELFNLSGLDLVESVVVDGMHDLFLGLTQFHCRFVLGLDSQEPAQQERHISAQQVSRIEHLIESEKSIDSVEQQLDIPMLRVICANRNIFVLPGKGKHLRRKDMIEALKVSVGHITEVQVADIEEPLLVGDAVVDEVSNEILLKSDGKDYYKKLNRNDRWLMHQVIESVIRPDWHDAPPQDLGSQSHGKLKADQWRSCIEFDIPIAMAKIMSISSKITGGEYHVYRERLFESTMLLAMAIRWGTSRTTSSVHAEKYTSYMLAYLNSLRRMNIDLRPNHHNAMHVGPFLLRFGPMHGWWSYPIERLIGVLQKVQTNSKIGQMEKTMLQTLCTANNIKHFFGRPESSDLLKEAENIFLECFDQSTGNRGTFVTDLLELNTNPPIRTVLSKDIKWDKSVKIPEDVRLAIRDVSDSLAEHLPFWKIPERVFTHKWHNVGNLKFHNFTSSSAMSLVFFQPLKEEKMIAGKIRSIVSVICTQPGTKICAEYILFVIHRFNPPSLDCTDDIFVNYPDFDIYLTSDTTADAPDIIPAGRKLCHAVASQWSKGILAMKPLN